MKISKENLIKLVRESVIEEMNQYDEFGFYNEPEEQKIVDEDVEQILFLLEQINSLNILESDQYAKELADYIRDNTSTNNVPVDVIIKLKQRLNNKFSQILQKIDMIDHELDSIIKTYK